jgi:sulfide:quinone oxidoreductase
MCQHMHGRALTAKFDGYASCPLLVGDGKAILAEFIYGGVPQEVNRLLHDL